MPFPSIELHTPRLLLRPFRPADVHGVFKGLSDPQVTRHYGVSYATLESTQTQMAWYAQIQQEGSGQWWCVCLAEAPAALIGACGLNDIDATHRRGELGYWMLPAYWRRGLAAEALSVLLRHAFHAMQLHRVGADVDTDNHASARLLERMGFTREGVRRGYEMKDGHPIDLPMFSLLSTDLPRRTAAG